MSEQPVPPPSELRLFHARDRYIIPGRGELFCGPCPFDWLKERDGSLAAWTGRWLISHPEADHEATYTVRGVESYCIPHISAGTPVGILVRKEPTHAD